MHSRVQKWGNSLAVRIPKPLAEDAEVKEDTVLNLAVSDGKIVATPVRRRKISLTQLLAKVNRQTFTQKSNWFAGRARDLVMARRYHRAVER